MDTDIRAEDVKPDTSMYDGKNKETINYEVDFEFSSPYAVAGKGHRAFEIDMDNIIFSNSPYEIHYVYNTWGIDQVQDMIAQSDTSIFGWHVIAEETTAHADLSTPIYEFKWGAYTRDGIGKLSYENLNAYKIGMAEKKYPFAYLTKQGYEDIQIFDTDEQAIEALAKGEIDIWFAEVKEAYYNLTEQCKINAFAYHSELEVPVQVGYMVQKGNKELLSFLNNRIKEIKNDGTYEALYQKYFTTHSPDYIQKEALRFKAVVIVLSMIICMLVVVIVIGYYGSRKFKKLKGELEQRLEELKESREQFRIAVEVANVGIIYAKSNKEKIYMSQRFREMLGMEKDMQCDLNTLMFYWLSVIHPDDSDKIIELNHNAEVKEIFSYSVEARLGHDEHQVKWIWIRINGYYEEDIFILGGSITDITTRKEQETAVKYLAEHDVLTGIYNRHKLTELAELEIESAKQSRTGLSLMYFDLDNFKAVNDNYGHLQGDLVLCKVVKSVRNSIPKRAIFARVGGDEFVIVLTDEYRALPVAQKILNNIANVSGMPVQIGASLGIAFYPDHGTSLDELVKNADTASRVAKQTGKNQIVLFQDL